MFCVRSVSGMLTLLCLVLCACVAMLGQTAHWSGTQVPIMSIGQYVTGLALDRRNDLFAVDQQAGIVQELTASGQKVTIADGLNFPWGIAVDQQGNLYITQEGSDGSAQILLERVTVTSAGNAYTPALLTMSGAGQGTSLAVDEHGRIFVSFFDRIVVLTPSSNSYQQSVFPLSTAIVPGPLAVDTQGALYLADMATYRVLKETPAGTGYVESTVAPPLAQPPASLAVDASGNVYIDAYIYGGFAEDFFIVKETPSPTGYQQSQFAISPFANPWSIAVTTNGTLYGGGSRGFEKVLPGAGMFAPVDATPFPYQYTTPEVISVLFTFDSAGTLGAPLPLTQGTAGLDFRDQRTGSCSTSGDGHVFAAGDTCSIDVTFYPKAAGLRLGAVLLQNAANKPITDGYVSGIGTGAQVSFLPAARSVVQSGLQDPSGIAIDPAGHLYFATTGSGILHQASLSGAGWNLAEIASGLNHPTAVAIDGRGNLFVAATNVVYRETPDGTHFVQSEPVSISGQLNGIAVDRNGNLYLTSALSGNVHKYSYQPDGSYVSSAIGFGIANPAGVAVDGAGNVFVTDPRQGDVYEEVPQADGSYRQSVLASGIAQPTGLALDAGGNVYITSASSGDLYREALRSDGTRVQSLIASGLEGPGNIALDTAGNIYVSLDLAQAVDKINLAGPPPPLIFAKTAVGSTSTDSPQLLTVLSIGTEPPVLNNLPGTSQPTLSSGFHLNAATTCPTLYPTSPGEPQDAGGSCMYAIDFTPVTPALARGTFGVEYVDPATVLFFPTTMKKTVELREAGITADGTRTSVHVSSSRIKQKLGVQIVATVADSSYASIIPQGGSVIFTDTFLDVTTPLNRGVGVPLTHGSASLSLVAGMPGTHTVTAHYVGVDARFIASTGQALFSVTK